MSAIVYFHAFFKDAEIQIEDYLIKFYNRINNGRGDITGLITLKSVLTREILDDLLTDQPSDFKQKIDDYFSDSDLTGFGIWSKWSDGKYIDEFYKSNLHQRFIEYAINTLDKARYLVIQYRDDKVKSREIKQPTK